MIAKKLKMFQKQTKKADRVGKLPPSIDQLIKITLLSDANNRENFKKPEVVEEFKNTNRKMQQFLLENT